MADRGRGRGRGNALLELLKKSQAAAAAPPVVESPPVPIVEAPVAQPPAPAPQPTSSAKGRASLLQFVQKTAQPKAPGPQETPPQAAAVRPTATPESKPSTPSPTPQSFGRASLLSLAQKFQESEVGRSRSISPATTEASSTKPTSSGDGGGVLGRLSELAIDDSQNTSGSVPISRQGTSGKPVNITANYIDLKIEPGKGIFRYEVKFAPEVDAAHVRRNLLNQHIGVIGTSRTFDGVMLYLPIKLPQARTTFDSIHPGDGSTVKMTIIFQKQQKLADSIAFFNVLLGRVMRALQLVRIGRDNYNPRCAHAVPQHKMELWPGYVTAIDEYEGGLKLNINASHRVMRTDTVRDLIGETFRNARGDAREAAKAEILGLTVLTRYNNRTYRIDDVEWDKNPNYTFDKKGEQITLFEYYKTHWNIHIKDLQQPLLLNRYKEKLPNGETKELSTLLVPELCYLSGLTDKLRSDFRVMKDLAAVTQVGPEERRTTILNFIKDVKKNEVAMEMLNGWGLQLADSIVQLKGRSLEPETIFFGDGRTFSSEKADWGGAAVSNPMLRTPNMTSWCILSTEKDSRVCNEFVSMLQKVSSKMSMNVTPPKVIALRNDRMETYLTEIRKAITPDMQMVVAICPTNRNDRYAAIKKLCCVDKPIRSQVIITKTISRGDKLKSVTEKIALQLNCKLGGALWALKIPFDNCMICGVDVYHAAAGEKSKGSVGAFVASLDKPLTSWYSRICLQRANQELIGLLKICLIDSVKAYAKRNGTPPQRIIIYRDGVGDGQLDHVASYEIKQLEEAFSAIDETYKPKLTVIVVQKRINTRLMADMRGRLQNPSPGTVVDSIVTRRNWYDFFLIPQTSRQGTVSPTHYIVIHDGAEMKTDHVQRLSFKLCHLYYNWPGTVKVPAPCQYAHKLAYLVGQSIGQEPSETLAESLYYL